MNRIHIVGCKNSGKTTLIVDLLPELVSRGYRVGAIKHSSHRHEVDVPGKDSHRHRTAGGAPAAMISGGMMAVYLPIKGDENAYEQLEAHYACCDLVLVEGGLDSGAPKVEMWRSARENPPIARTRGDIAAVVTDDPVEVAVPCWARSDVPALADHILALAGLGKRPGDGGRVGVAGHRGT